MQARSRRSGISIRPGESNFGSRVAVNHEGRTRLLRGSGVPVRPSAGDVLQSRLLPSRFRPHLTLAVKERPPGRGVVAAEIDLQFVEGVIRQARVGSAGYAYAIDSHGQLVAHPSIDLVLGRADFVRLPQVRSALSGAAKTATSATASGRNWHGTKSSAPFRRSIRRAGACSWRSR